MVLAIMAKHGIIDKLRPLGITNELMSKVGMLYANHPFTTLFIVKMIPFLPPSGLTAAGAVRMPIGKFSFWSLIITIPSSGLYFLTGYLAGEEYARIAHYQELALAAIAIAIVAIVFAYNKLMAGLGKKMAPKELR
jgi:membrane protein DedA with SNARE-associated domain